MGPSFVEVRKIEAKDLEETIKKRGKVNE